MRRIFLALLLGMPASALGQSAGSILTDSSTINIAQCSGVRNALLDLSDELNMGLTWQVTMASGVGFASGGTFQVYAANQAVAAGDTSTGSTLTSCTEQRGSASGFVVGQVGSDLDAPTQSITTPESFAMTDIAAAAGYTTCDVESSTHTIYLCVQWNGPSGEVGWATGSVTLDLRQPAAPTAPSASPGDGKLHVTCTGGTNDASFKARAYTASESHLSSASSSCDLNITGLTNGTAYTVEVYGLSSANNPSAASDSTTGTPAPTDDFWRHYKNDGGPESGGCGSAAGAAALLGSLSLLALRRRKP